MIEEKDSALNSERITDRSRGIPTILDDGLKILLEKVKGKNPQNILEIGTATGLSAIEMLSCCDGKITTIEINEKRHNEAVENIKKYGFEDRATLLLGDSAEVLKQNLGTFDFVFLDGSKSHYLECLYLIEPMLKKGAVVVGDNVLFRGFIRGGVKYPHRQNTIVNHMRAFLDYVENGGKYDTVIYEVGDGVSVSVYKG